MGSVWGAGVAVAIAVAAGHTELAGEVEDGEALAGLLGAVAEAGGWVVGHNAKTSSPLRNDNAVSAGGPE